MVGSGVVAVGVGVVVGDVAVVVGVVVGVGADQNSGVCHSWNTQIDASL